MQGARSRDPRSLPGLKAGAPLLGHPGGPTQAFSSRLCLEHWVVTAGTGITVGPTAPRVQARPVQTTKEHLPSEPPARI